MIKRCKIYYIPCDFFLIKYIPCDLLCFLNTYNLYTMFSFKLIIIPCRDIIQHVLSAIAFHNSVFLLLLFFAVGGAF